MINEVNKQGKVRINKNENKSSVERKREIKRERKEEGWKWVNEANKYQTTSKIFPTDCKSWIRGIILYMCKSLESVCEIHLRINLVKDFRSNTINSEEGGNNSKEKFASTGSICDEWMYVTGEAGNLFELILYSETSVRNEMEFLLARYSPQF